MIPTLNWQTNLFTRETNGYQVEKILPRDAKWFALNVHYAKRLPSITHAFGLFLAGNLVGVVTFGTPPSSTLCKGICGEQYKKNVLELNRLVLLNNLPNEASRLVGKALRMLPSPSVVVSFADTDQDHIGYVYQATNFVYTGMSAKFKDPKVKGLEHQHHATYAHGLTNAQVIKKYGLENVSFVERSSKHRYVYFVGNKKQKCKLREALRYKITDYPKLKEGAF